jgi:peptidoglycan pentaglycine glycine transferase (the first glycine)
LSGSEEQWLARMSKKTRACFRAAERGGVTVRSSNNVEEFFGMLAETGLRDQFGVHTQDYYRKVYALFAAQQAVTILLAEWEGQLLAGLMVFSHDQLYAASRAEQRQLNPTYLVQLEAMRWAASKGCREYDLYGVPDYDEAILESEFTEKHDGLWGVYGYKRKFGGRLMRTAGAWERIYFPPLFAVYRLWIARRGGEGG